MIQPDHLTDEQVSRHRDRTLTAAELLELDDHIAACPPCRERLYTNARTSSRIKALRAGFSKHLAYSDIVACSEGNGKPHQLNHIRECAPCQAEVQDLSRFRTELVETPRRPLQIPVKPWVRYRIPLGIAAAVLVIAGATMFVLRRPRPTAPSETAATLRKADPSIPAAERKILELAIASGRLERAPVLDKLITARGALLSPTAPKPPIQLLEPVATTVLADRPVFRWTPGSNALSYIVAVFDEKFQKIAESPALTSTDWRPPGPLPRDKALIWQVTMRTGGGSVNAPAPPEPEARFQIVDPQVGERIEALRRDFPGNPLLLAALYAHAGALDDAEDMLRSMDPAVAQSYRESLRRIRFPE